MKVTTFHAVLPLACALMPVKLRLAKIQMAEAPPCVPAVVETEVSWAAAVVTNAKKIRFNCQRWLIKLLSGAAGRKRKLILIVIVRPAFYLKRSV